MIRLEEIIVRGSSDVGPFVGAFSFARGLQVISAPNHFGKSLAVKAIAWCLGLEPMFGSQDNDVSCFPVAVRDVLDLGDARNVPVTSSEAALTLAREDGMRIRIIRAIKGDPAEVILEELGGAGEIARTSRLNARRRTMKDEHAGLQHFLFDWIHLPRAPVMMNTGSAGEVYLENIAPLFFIDQNEGWTDLQSLQVYRYGLQQIFEIAVEYLLGAVDAIAARFAVQTVAAREARLKGAAAGLANQVVAVFAKQGWVYNWSAHGSVSEIANRWSRRTLLDIAREEFRFNLQNEQTRLRERANSLREALAHGPLDRQDTSASSDTSQKVIELKTQRHALREELRTARSQAHEQSQLVESLQHRIHSASDVLRLKRDGIGRLINVECPTCHRFLDPSTFDVSTQSAGQVEAHIDALERDRLLVSANLQSAEAQTTRLAAELSRVDEQLRTAERALANVNAAAGSIREQLARVASDLASAEREIDRNAALADELAKIQLAIDNWLAEMSAEEKAPSTEVDLALRRSSFVASLRTLLRALGHSAITTNSESALRLDDQYLPYLGPRRLRSLGSASDHSRLVAAYVLALAEASRASAGLHPGFVVLDEPLQQNPDAQHREFFVGFLQSAAAQKLQYQTIVFTSLRDDEVSRLKDSGVRVITPEGPHFLRPISPQTESLEGGGNPP
ncbi:MAG TPA: hypothetical protein VIX59_20335 [Candidatus Binataceae bacterium]